jgi:hypothetical protein
MRRKFTVNIDGGSFDIVTTSPRRYLVVDIRARWTIKRTDSAKVAYRLRVQDPLRRVIIDTLKEGRANGSLVGDSIQRA